MAPHTPAVTNRRLLWCSRLISLTLSTCLTLVLVEYAWRLLKFRRLTIAAGIEDPHFHHRLKPYETYRFLSKEFDVGTRTNRYGLRGADPRIPKPPGTVRLLMVGDSFTFGFPVKDDETFCALIERGLNARGYPVEVINGGVSGASPTLHYIALRDQFLTFEPDLVILWYDLGDLQEDAWFQKNLLYDADGRIIRCDPRYINGRFGRWEWLKNHSVVANYVDRKLLRPLEYLRVLGPLEFARTKWRGERAKVAVARVKATRSSGDLAESDKFLLVRESSTAALVQPSWELSVRYLRMIRDLLAERHISFLFGTYPYGMLAGADQWADGRTFWGFEKGRRYEPVVAQGLFKTFSEREGVPWLDTLAAFREAAKTQKLYYDWDGHFTPAGHRALAERVLADERVLSIVRKAVERTRRSRAQDAGGKH